MWLGLVLALALAFAPPAAAKDDVFMPPQLASHGVFERDLCFRGGSTIADDGAMVIADPAPCRAQNPHPHPLPVHAGGRVAIRLPKAADEVTVDVGARTIAAIRIDSLVWIFRMPHVARRGRLGISIGYPDGHAAWAHPYAMHGHRTRGNS